MTSARIFGNKGILVIIITLLSLCVYFPLFLHLTNPPVRIWDESRVALNAYEMAHSGNWITTQYKGSPDMWNTKPPLLIWVQVIFIKLFGFNELSIRLPSAFAALFTCIVIFVFSYKFIKSLNLGLSAVLILVTSSGYIAEHVTRTGDYDSLLVLLTTTSLLCFFIYTESDEKRGKTFLLFFFIALTLSLLCKGVAGVMFLPSLIIYCIVTGKSKKILSERNFYSGISIFLVLGIGYYVLREIFNPGYLNAVWQNELGGRYLEPNEGHEGPFWYYYQRFINQDFQYWYLLIPCGFGIGIFYADKRIRNLTWFLALCIVQFFITISFGNTKLEWYSAPLFPLLALLSGIFLSWIMNLLREQEIFRMGLSYPILPVILLFLIFIKPYAATVDRIYNFKEEPWAVWWYEIPDYLKSSIGNGKNFDGYYITSSLAPQLFLFYKYQLFDKAQKIYIVEIDDLRPDNIVILSEENFFSQLEQRFNTSVLEKYKNVRVYKINSLK